MKVRVEISFRKRTRTVKRESLVLTKFVLEGFIEKGLLGSISSWY